MALSDRLAIIITANGSQAVGEFNRVGRAAGRSLTQAETRAQRLGSTMTRVGAAMLTAGAVATVGMFKLAQASEQQRLAEISLQNALNNSPVITNRSTQAYLEQASALQQVTVAGDEEIVAAQARLATFRVTEDQIRGLTPLIVDYARKYGVDLVTAANQVGKAMAGNQGALQRQGVMIDDAAFATDRYSAVMAALRENAGGFAEAEGATFSGRVQIMQNQLGELAEGVGAGAVDAFTNLLGVVDGVSGAMGSAGSGSQQFAGQLLTYGALGVTASGALSLVVGGVMRFAGQARAAADAAYMLYLRVRTSNMTLGQMAGSAAGAAGALAVIAIVWQKHSEWAAQSAAADESARAAMEGITDETGRLAAGLEGMQGSIDQASGQELQDAMAAAGVGVGELREAAEAGGPALDNLIDRLVETGEVSNDTRSLLEQFGSQSALGFVRGTADISNSTMRTRAAIESLMQDLEAEGAETAAFDGVAGAADAAEAQVEELTEAIQAYVDEVYGVQASGDAVQESFNSLFESLVANGPVMEGNTQQALANREAWRSTATSVAEFVSSQAEAGTASTVLQGTLWTTVGRLQDMRNAGLITEAQFASMSAEILGVPTSVSTTVSVPGGTAAQQILANVRDAANSIPKRVQIDLAVLGVNTAIMQLNNAQFAANHYSGGPIPGTGPKMLVAHGGEYVLSADQVDRIKRGRQSRGAKAAPAASGQMVGGGGGPTVVFQGPVYGMDDLERKIMAALRKAERAVAA